MIYTRNGVPVETFNPDMFSMAYDIRGLSLKDIHEGTGIPMPDLKQMDSGIRQPTLDQVKALSEMLGFPIAWFYREGERHPENIWMCRASDWFDDLDDEEEFEELPHQLRLFGDEP